MAISELKARLAQLSFKKSTEGLTPAEEQEFSQLRQALQMETASGAIATPRQG